MKIQEKTLLVLGLVAGIGACKGTVSADPELPDTCRGRVAERVPDLSGHVSLAGEQLTVLEFSDHDIESSDGNATNLVDLRGATVWRGRGKRPWILVDLGESHVVTGIAVQRASFRHLDDPSAVEIQVSDDGRCFGDPVFSSQLDEPTSELEFEGGFRSRFVRASFMAKPGDDSIAVAELEIMVHATLSMQVPSFVVAGRDATARVEMPNPSGFDRVSFSLVSAPSGASIDAATGEIAWRPTARDFGLADFVVGASGHGIGGLSAEISVPVAMYRQIHSAPVGSAGVSILIEDSGTALDGTRVSVAANSLTAPEELQLGWLEFAAGSDPHVGEDEVASAPPLEISTTAAELLAVDVLFPEAIRQWLDVDGARAAIESHSTDIDGAVRLVPIAKLDRLAPVGLDVSGQRVFIPTSGCSAIATNGDITVDWQFLPVGEACPPEEARERAVTDLARIIGDIVTVFRNKCDTPETLALHIRDVPRGHFNPQTNYMEMEAAVLEELVLDGSIPTRTLVRFIHEVAHWVQSRYWTRAPSYHWEALAELMVAEYFPFAPSISDDRFGQRLTSFAPESLTTNAGQPRTNGSSLANGTSSYHLYALFRYLQDDHDLGSVCSYYDAQRALLAEGKIDEALHAQLATYDLNYALFVSIYNRFRDKTNSFDGLDLSFTLPVRALELRGTEISMPLRLGGGDTQVFRGSTTASSFELESSAPDGIRYLGHLWYTGDELPSFWFDAADPIHEFELAANREFIVTVVRIDGRARKTSAVVEVVLRRGDLTTVVGTVDDDYFSDPALIELTIPGTTYRRWGTANNDGEFRIEQVPASLGPVVARAMCWEGNENVGDSGPIDPVAMGETYVGVIDLPDDCGFDCKDLCSPEERDSCPWVPCPQSGQCAHISWFCDGISAGHCGLPDEDETQCYDGRACDRLVQGGPIRGACGNWCEDVGYTTRGNYCTE